MALKLIAGPTVEPLDLQTVKSHLRLDSGSLADNITTVQSIAPGAHVIAASYSLVGTGVDVLGYRVIVNLNSGTSGAGGTVNAKIQESDDNITYADWTGGTFTAVTEANDNAVQEKEYTGTKQYIRVVATVAVATCDFGADIIKEQSYSSEDDLLTALITTAREWCEGFQNRAFCTQTWELVLDDWPDTDRIKIPLPPLQSVTTIKYKDTAGVETTWAATNYIVDIDNEPGNVVLAYGMTWPSTTLYPVGGIRIRFVAGYGLASAVPKAIKQAMLLMIGHWYENRETIAVGTGNFAKEIPLATSSLLWMHRMVPI